MLKFLHYILSALHVTGKPKPSAGMHLAAVPGGVVLLNIRTKAKIVISPDLAEKLAQELPGMAALARRMEAE